jgi:hypothetical protein
VAGRDGAHRLIAHQGKGDSGGETHLAAPVLARPNQIRGHPPTPAVDGVGEKSIVQPWLRRPDALQPTCPRSNAVVGWEQEACTLLAVHEIRTTTVVDNDRGTMPNELRSLRCGGTQ